MVAMGALALFTPILLVSEDSDTPQSPGSLLPTPIDSDQFAGLLEHSPFTRVLDFSETIRLTGVAMINGRQVATVHDRAKRKSYVVSGETNKVGWKMVEVETHADPSKVSATISVNGGELVTLQFDEKQLHPEQSVAASKPGSKASSTPDKRPPPTKDERRKFGEKVRSRMSKMSDEQKKRVGQIMQEKMKGNPKLSDRQKGEVFVKILDHVDSGK